jgi:hypothetical protein
MLLPASGGGVGYRFELHLHSGNSSFCLPRGCYEARATTLTPCSAQLEWTLGGKRGDGHVHTRVVFCSDDASQRNGARYTRSLWPDAFSRSTERFETAHATLQVMLAGAILATVLVTLCVASVDDRLAGHDPTWAWRWDRARATLSGAAAEPSGADALLSERPTVDGVESPLTDGDGAARRSAPPAAGIELRSTTRVAVRML